MKGSRLFNSSTVQPFNSREAALAALRNAADTPSAEETDLARALQSDLRPVAERLRDLLQEEGEFAAACKRLRGELPDLLREIGQEESAFAKALEGILAAGGEAGGKGKLEGLEGLENLEGGEAGALANGECRAKDPAHCWTHGTPERRSLRDQLTDLGYKNRSDLETQAQAVPAERISKIASGNMKEHCKMHEAIAVLRANHKVKNALGQDVEFGEDMVEHYLFDRGREGNQPDVQRLKELPLAMYAVTHDRNPKLQYPPGVTPDALHPPRGTQYVYTEEVGGGTMKCRAWVDSGKVKGWYVE